MITNISFASFAGKGIREIEGSPEGHEKSIPFLTMEDSTASLS